MKCQVLVDWLTFSVKTDNPQEVIQNYLGLDPALFQDPGYGLLGYNKVLRFGDIAVCYEPRQNDYFRDMGICVSMSGNGCRTFESMSRFGGGTDDAQDTPSAAFPALFRLLAADERVNISRIDIACDDKEGYLDMSEIVSKAQANEINSRMTRRSVVVSYDGSQRDGSTVYIGSPSSDFRVRIYDKALEQGTDGHWIRVELVMRSANANAFVSQMTTADSVGKLAAQVINDKFSFIERDDSNITRCTVSVWWQAFVDELDAIRLVTRGTIEHSVERIRNWIEAQVGPSLAVLFKTLGSQYVSRLALDAIKRLNDKQKFHISDFNAQKLVAV